MSDISTQFHATPGELALFVKDMLSQFDLHITGMSFPPFQTAKLVGKQIEDGIINGPFYGLAFTESDPGLPITQQKVFGEKNPGALYLDIGRLTAKGLGESWLACRTNNAPLPVTWKKFQAKLRSLTKCGAVAIHPDGPTAIIRNHRYTSGAKKLNDQGVAMLPMAGFTTYKLGG